MAGNLVIHPNQSVRTSEGVLKYGDEDRLYEIAEDEDSGIDVEALEEKGVLVDEDHTDVLAFNARPRKRNKGARRSKEGRKATKKRSDTAASNAKKGGTKGKGSKKAKKEGEEAEVAFSGPYRVHAEGDEFQIRDVNDQVYSDDEGAAVFESQDEADEFVAGLNK